MKFRPLLILPGLAAMLAASLVWACANDATSAPAEAGSDRTPPSTASPTPESGDATTRPDPAPPLEGSTYDPALTPEERTQDPAPTPSPATTPIDELTPEQLELRNHIRSEASQLSYWLTIASGQAPSCDATCERVDDPIQVWEGLARHCSKIDTLALAEMARNLEPEDQQIADAVAESCASVATSVATGGEPSDSVEWQGHALTALAPLDAVAQLLG